MGTHVDVVLVILVEDMWNRKGTPADSDVKQDLCETKAGKMIFDDDATVV